jgi:hypothetical protein
MADNPSGSALLKGATRPRGSRDQRNVRRRTGIRSCAHIRVLSANGFTQRNKLGSSAPQVNKPSDNAASSIGC